jgi:hypothetical protein
MKSTDPDYTETLNGAEEAKLRERTKGNAGGDCVERRVRLVREIDWLIADMDFDVMRCWITFTSFKIITET